MPHEKFPGDPAIRWHVMFVVDDINVVLGNTLWFGRSLQILVEPACRAASVQWREQGCRCSS